VNGAAVELGEHLRAGQTRHEEVEHGHVGHVVFHAGERRRAVVNNLDLVASQFQPLGQRVHVIRLVVCKQQLQSHELTSLQARPASPV
jgi:hypothetical protein